VSRTHRTRRVAELDVFPVCLPARSLFHPFFPDKLNGDCINAVMDIF